MTSTEQEDQQEPVYTEGDDPLAPTEDQRPAPAISGAATKALSDKMREWSGWPDARLVFGTTDNSVSPWATTTFADRTFTVDPSELVLNPNRVLNTITPFRLRQEAVLTGILLHEAGHARHSHWTPQTPEQAKAMLDHGHSDGKPVSRATFDLARLMEEPRIEGLMASEELEIGSYGLSWTMQASAAHLLPMTKVSRDPAQAMMDVLRSWVLRAGRKIALHKLAGAPLPQWASDFTALLAEAIDEHLAVEQMKDPSKPINIPSNRFVAIKLLGQMLACRDDSGPTMLDKAREVLALLFPNTDPQDQPSPSPACTGGQGASPSTESGDAESDGDEGEGDGGGDSVDHENEGKGAASFAEKVESQEQKADASIANETESESQAQPPEQPSEVSAHSAGNETGQRHADWRTPTKDEREIQRQAEHFLRTLVDPSEGSKVTLTDTPSATVDGAALAAWKAGGMVREPHFFVRTRREVQPQPPVKIAILVDISSSMGVLQKPSALLSWALSSAAFDLRNFAGRGQQIESCLIHWGTSARTMVEVGEMIPGIREVRCNEGTTAMAEALELVEEQMPGFFDTGKASNRLLVQFTDWEIWGPSLPAAQSMVARALNNGVNMLCVAPRNYSGNRSTLDSFLQGAMFSTGKTRLMQYDPRKPGAVWDEAAELLR